MCAIAHVYAHENGLKPKQNKGCGELDHADPLLERLIQKGAKTNSRHDKTDA